MALDAGQICLPVTSIWPWPWHMVANGKVKDLIFYLFILCNTIHELITYVVYWVILMQVLLSTISLTQHQRSRSQISISLTPCRFEFPYEFKSLCNVKLHCSVFLSSHIVAQSLPNAKVTAGHRTVPYAKFTGLNIFRDFRFNMIKKFR